MISRRGKIVNTIEYFYIKKVKKYSFYFILPFMKAEKMTRNEYYLLKEDRKSQKIYVIIK